MDNWINLIPILIIVAACFYVIINNSWQKIFLGFGVVYLAAFSIIIQFWSFSFSIVKVFVGLMSLVVLGISVQKHFEFPAIKTKSELVFRIVAQSLIFILVGFMGYRISNYLSIQLEIVLASLLIVGFGIFQLGTTHEPYKLFLAILVLFFGFELIFSANEFSLLVNGLLAFISLLVALMGGFMIVNQFEGDEE